MKPITTTPFTLCIVTLTYIAHADENKLPPIKVTAPTYKAVTVENKSGEEIISIPSAVIVIPKNLLADQGVNDMNSALRNVSGLQATDSGMANDYRARGLGVTFFRDNIFDGSAQNSYYRSMVDIEEIEVSKGSGSALFGSAAPGASINLITKKPEHTFNLNLGASYGSFATRNAFADITGEVSKGAAGRLIINTEKSNGYRNLNRELLEILPSIMLDLSENRTLLLDIDYRKSQITPDNYGIPFNFERKIADVSNKNRYYTPFANVDQAVTRASITHDWQLSDSLNMTTTFVNDSRDLDILRNVRGNAQNAAGTLVRRSLRQQFDDANYLTLQNELNWAVKSGHVQHNVTVGLAYNNTNIDTLRNGYRLPDISDINYPTVLEKTIIGLPRDQSRSFDREITSTTLSSYLQDQVTLSNQWKLRAGLRNDHVNAEDKGVEGTTGYREISYKKNLLSGSLGLTYQPIPTASLYTSYSKGAFNNINTKVSQLSVRPETSQQLEIGSKFKLLDDQLNLNIALFKIKRENYLFDLPEAESTSDGKDKSHGIEIDLAATPFTGLKLSANATLQKPVVETDVLASLNALGISNVSTKGTTPVGVSRQMYNAWANYTFQQAALNNIDIGLGASFHSEAFADALNAYKVPSYMVLDASARYKGMRTKNGQWELGLFIKNLTNKHYYATTTNIGALPADERSAFLTFKFNYK